MKKKEKKKEKGNKNKKTISKGNKDTKKKKRHKNRKTEKKKKTEKFLTTIPRDSFFSFFQKLQKVMFGKTSPQDHQTNHNLSQFIISYDKLGGLVVKFSRTSLSIFFKKIFCKFFFAVFGKKEVELIHQERLQRKAVQRSKRRKKEQLRKKRKTI